MNPAAIPNSAEGQLRLGTAADAVHGKTWLVLDKDAQPNKTSRRETDASRALTRGLAEYLAAISFVDYGGRQLKLKSVQDVWAEPEDGAEYPSGIVFAPETGRYDAARLTPETSTTAETPDGLSLRSGSEFVVRLYVDLFCADPDERTGLVAMVEDALLPVEWIYGARLALPHYFGVFADFALEACTYDDSAVTARQRLRIARLEVSASIAVLRAVRLPIARIKPRVEVVPADGSIDTPTKSVVFSRGK